MRSKMSTLSATSARAKFYRLIDEVAISHKPIVIMGKHANAVLISEEDWNTIQKILYKPESDASSQF